MKKEPLVFVIIISYNGKEDTCECLDSVMCLNYSNFEILVVDNGSVDGSVQSINTNYPSVKVIENHKNLGFAEGNNVGIKYALEQEAEFILLLNNDTVVSDSLLQELVGVVIKDESIGITGPKILNYYKRNRIWFAGGKVFLWLGITLHIGNKHKDSRKYQKIIAEDYQTGCALFIRREVLLKVGILDSSHVAYFEDVDLCWRAKKAGYRILCIQNTVIWHKVSQSFGGGMTPKKLYLKTQSGVRFFKKYSPRLAYIVTIPVCVFFYIMMVSISEKLKGNHGVFTSLIRGIRDGIVNIPVGDE